nr:arginine N-succinyltransferase [Sphingomonas cavernae]
MPFTEADRMVMSTDGQFILDLAPRHPIYVELIDEAACNAIGRCHRDGEAAMAMLKREGFSPSGLIDIFDGGPTVTAPRDAIATIRGGRTLRVAIDDDAGAAEPALLSTTAIASFRAIRADVSVIDNRAVIGRDAARLLGVTADDMIRVNQ